VTLKEKGTKPIMLTPIKKIKIEETIKGNPDKFRPLALLNIPHLTANLFLIPSVHKEERQ
jgi:hypothetical protein